MFKFLVWHVLIVTASCELFKEESGYVLNYAPVYSNYKPRDYQFDYAVSDPHTGDHKSQWEVKINGVVRGAYSLLEPDGTTRIVEYVADDDGFRAVVNKVGTTVHPVPVVPQTSYRSYDGHVANYIPQYGGVQSVEVVPSTVQHEVVHQIPVSQVVPSIQEQNLGLLGVQAEHGEQIGLLQDQNLHAQVVPTIQGQIGVELGRRDDLSLLQGQNVHAQVVPSIQGQIVGELGRQDDFSLVQGQNLHRQVVPTIQEQIGGELDRRNDLSLLQGQTVHGQVVPTIQGDLGRQDLPLLRGQNVHAQVVPTFQGQIGEAFGRRDDLSLLQGQNVHTQVVPTIQGQTGGEVSGRDELSLLQGHNLNVQVIPATHAQSLGQIGIEQGRRDDLSFIQGQNLHDQSVPNIGRQNLGQFGEGQILRGHVVPNIEDQEQRRREDIALLQGHNLRAQVVPSRELGDLSLIQGHTLEGRGPNLRPLQGELARLVNTGQLEVVPPLQRPNLGVNLRIPYKGPNVDLPQYQEQVPVDPSYSTVVEYQGLGNDNRLKKDVYHSSYSEKVLKMVPSPRKSVKKTKKEFLIYYPESERH